MSEVLTGFQNDNATSNRNVCFEISDYQFRKEYYKGSAKREAYDNWLGQQDRTNIVWGANESGGDTSWQNYVAPYYIDTIQNLQIKTPDFASTICPTTITTPRDPAVILELEEGTDDKKPYVQFLGATSSIDAAMHTYGKKQIGLRRWGSAFSIANETLSDCTLDLISHRLTVMTSQEIMFRQYWLTSTLHEYTDGTWEASYDNSFNCEGAQVTYTDAAGTAKTDTISVSVRDILKALHQFSKPLTPEMSAIGRAIKGYDYYQPTMLVLPPKVAMEICLSLLGSFSQFGNVQLNNQVVNSAFLQSIFQVPVVVCNTSRWTPTETKTPNNFDVSNYDCYIIDQSKNSVVNLQHKDGQIVSNWIEQNRAMTCWSKRVRSNYHVLDPKAIMRLIPYPAGS